MSENQAIFNNTAINLSWNAVTNADLYSIQISLYADFSEILVQQNDLVSPSHSFADEGLNAAKRYWRWKYSTDSGSTWSAWSEVGSYWLDTDLTVDYTPLTGGWAFVSCADATDQYTLSVAPRHLVVERSINRIKERNRAGDLLSEYLTTKAIISLDFPEDGYMGHEQFREIIRFNTEVKTFLLVSNTDNGTDHVTRVWKVQFTDDPEIGMFTAGREDLLTGTLELEEV